MKRLFIIALPFMLLAGAILAILSVTSVPTEHVDTIDQKEVEDVGEVVEHEDSAPEMSTNECDVGFVEKEQCRCEQDFYCVLNKETCWECKSEKRICGILGKWLPSEEKCMECDSGYYLKDGECLVDVICDEGETFDRYKDKCSCKWGYLPKNEKCVLWDDYCDENEKFSRVTSTCVCEDSFKRVGEECVLDPGI